ncbi:MAG: Lar family restriction alleviation protein [Pseudomonadales bacterium]
MAEELKACPFCGGKAKTVQFTKKRWTVECFADGCGAGIISQGDMQTAIAAWNNRAQLPSQGGEAVEVVAHIIETPTAIFPAVELTQSGVRISGTHDLMTVAQHQRILAATVGSAEPVAMKTHGAWDGLDDLANLPDGTKLYTHPADQVADDLTMVKVSRELLQDLRDLAFDQVEHHRAAMGAYKQTRQSAMDSVLAQADALLRS